MILLLTGCINPNGMAFTALSNLEERKSQYINAIRYYLSNTNFQIVFCENSGTNISPLFQRGIDSGRMEYLTFNGNQDKERGKGYGECEIIEYALKQSKLISSSHDRRIAKITGRLIVRNITSIIKWHQLLFPKRTVFCAINSDLSFPDSRFILAPTSFFQLFLHSFFIMPHIEGISGSTGESYSQHTPHTFSFAFKYAKYAFYLRRRFIIEYR